MFIILIIKISTINRITLAMLDHGTSALAPFLTVFFPRAVQFIERFHSTSVLSACWVA